MVNYNYNAKEHESELKIENNTTEVRHIATGFMMIKREVIECMQKAFPSTHYVDDVGYLKEEEHTHAYALFDCCVEDGHYFSEDWLFCERWKKMGGKVYANISIDLTHMGTVQYEGSFLRSIL